MSIRLASLTFSLPAVLAGLLAGSSSGCFIDGGHGAPLCTTATTMPIDTGASITHAAGLDAGYYTQYTAGGHWHVEWTCDTKLSAAGCNFTGTITVDTPAAGAAPSCFQCESEDQLNVTAVGDQTRLDFDTITSSGIDGVDVDGVPGHPLQLNLQINDLDQNDLVFVPSLGRTAVPACMPLELTPTSP
jgi:hypothetical protein